MVVRKVRLLEDWKARGMEETWEESSASKLANSTVQSLALMLVVWLHERLEKMKEEKMENQRVH